MDHHTTGPAPSSGSAPAAPPTPAPRRPGPRPRIPQARLAAGCTAAAAALLLSACGSGSSADTSQKAPPASAAPSASSAPSADGMSGMAMGDPHATPADKLPGAEVVKGAFKLLDTRPPGMDDVKGTAWLAQGARGTTVTVSLTGLKPGGHYMAHLHARHCSADNGGPHFQFTEGGPTLPPNEVHLKFDADAAGKAMTTVNNPRKTGKGAVALVVHPVEAMDNRITCADFDF
ncbi:superoxide dismutase family protein [Streptomyces sp. MS06]|uniref:superoxide dismutase family protein n=1 Tax=Streptomyces sp. MS06 TaxID=3385974 RepID=UPI00399FB3A8